MMALVGRGVKLKFGLEINGEWREAEIPIEIGELAKAYRLTADDQPIILMSLAIHDDSDRYHTICRRIPDDTIDVYRC